MRENRWRSSLPRGSRRVAVAIGLILCGALLGVVASYLFSAAQAIHLQPWHELRPHGELRAKDRSAPGSLAEYRAMEARLFDEIAAELGRRVGTFPAFSRFDPASRTHPSRFERDWNRTFEWTPTGAVRGEALLLHGLSDSPYSLRAVGDLLAAAGFHAVVLRLPGHGTVPGSLAATSRDDWRAAVRLGVAATGGRAEAAGRPFVIVGYSNGAALALDYTLAALQDGGGRAPDRLVFLSPALAVRPAAAAARWFDRSSRLPGLGRLGWSSTELEFDPYKYNSFPVRAGAEIHDLTSEIEDRLERLEESAAGDLPPLLTLQSVVDATVPPVTSLTRLYGRVEGEGSELVLFDANHRTGISELLGSQAGDLLALARSGRRFDFRITLITNRGTGSAAVESRIRPAGSLEEVVTPLELAWPDGVYSLSHVAVPFPPDDPAYGIGTSPLGPPFPFGELDLKGERGVFLVPDRLLTRLRYNPFFAIVEDEILAFLEDGE